MSRPKVHFIWVNGSVRTHRHLNSNGGAAGSGVLIIAGMDPEINPRKATNRFPSVNGYPAIPARLQLRIGCDWHAIALRLQS